MTSLSRRRNRAPVGLVLLGDSLAVGILPYLKKWATSRGINFRSNTSSGRSTQHQGTTEVTPGALVVVSLGSHDATLPAANGVAIHQLMSAIFRAGAVCILWLIPPATKHLPGLATVREAIVQEAFVREAVDHANVTVVHTRMWLQPDGIHPADYSGVARDVIEQGYLDQWASFANPVHRSNI